VMATRFQNEALGCTLPATRDSKLEIPAERGRHMYCEKCRESLSADANFCPRCGRKAKHSEKRPFSAGGNTEPGRHSIATSRGPSGIVTAQGNDSVKRRSFWGSLFDWRMNDQELKEQLDSYSTLGWTRSYRKFSAALLWFSTIITLLLVLFNLFGIQPSAVSDVAIFLVLSWFVYKGHRWALITAMILWTIEKGDQVVQVVSADPSHSILFLSGVIWWATYMGVFWKAYRVEHARHKLISGT